MNKLSSSPADSLLSESQCSFRSGRSTVDMVFSLRKLREKAREHAKDFFISFVDFTKAFDTVSKDALRVVLRKISVPERTFSVIVSFNHGMMVSVRYSCEVSDLFIVFNGTKQGFVLVTLLFALYFSVIPGKSI